MTLLRKAATVVLGRDFEMETDFRKLFVRWDPDDRGVVTFDDFVDVARRLATVAHGQARFAPNYDLVLAPNSFLYTRS